MHTLVADVEKKYKKDKVPVIRPGDIVKVHQKIREGGKERVQVYDGIVIDIKKPNELAYAITVRKVSYGVGVEKTFPVHAPSVIKVDVLKHSKVRRANLAYLRGLADKKTRKKLKPTEAKELSFIMPEVKNMNEEEKKDAEVTEISTEAEGDALKTPTVPTEELEVAEQKLAGDEDHHPRGEEERNEQEDATAEVQTGLDKAEDEDSKAQSDQS